MTLADIHDTIIRAWRTREKQTLYNFILLKTDGTITIRKSFMETTFDPRGSEGSLRKFITSYIK